MFVEIVALMAIFLLFVIEIVVLVPFIAMSLSGLTEVPFVPTPHAAFGKIIDVLQIQSGDVVYELGSGDGRIILHFAKLYPQARLVGIERNPLLFAYAQMRWHMKGSPSNVEFRRGNLFKTDLSPANKVYCYLLPEVMDSLLPKCEQELTSARLASRAFQFNKKKEAEVVELSSKPGWHGQHLLYVYDF